MKWFYNLKTAVKLIIAFIIMALILAFVGIFGVNNLSSLNKSLSDMFTLRLQPIEEIMNAQISYQRLRANLFEFHLAETEEDRNVYLATTEELAQDIEDTITAYGNRTFNQQEHAVLYQKVEPAWQAFKLSFNHAIKLSKEGKDSEFVNYLGEEFQQTRTDFNNSLSDLTVFNVNSADRANQDGAALYSSSFKVTVIIIVISVIFSIGIGYYISQIISRPLNRVVGLVGKVAGGDLRETTDIDTKDEIGLLAKSVNHMVLNLRETVSGIMLSAESVSAASQQISASTEEIASGSMNQADAAQTVNETFGELSMAINSVASSAEEASQLSNNTMDIAENGGKVVRNSIVGMNQINEQMSQLEEDSNRIGEIIEVIDDIADQTNLLALNAAIEAARAGEQGRGFAVVADEVRKLAERSSEATKQITSIIKGMQENTKHSVNAVIEGVASTEKTGEAFESIISMVSLSAHKVMEIAAASEEQAAQSSEVLISIQSISAVTEEAAASTEETASTAQALAQLAEELSNSVSSFKV